MAVDFTRVFGLTPPFIGDLSPLCLIDASDLAKPVARRCTALLRGIKPSFTDRNRLSMRVIEPNWTSIYVRSSCVVRPADFDPPPGTRRITCDARLLQN